MNRNSYSAIWTLRRWIKRLAGCLRMGLSATNEHAGLCMGIHRRNARYSAKSGVRCRRYAHRQVPVRATRSVSWIRSAEHGFGRPVAAASTGKFLAEDLVHDLRASGKCWHDLVSVDQLGRGGLVVPREQRYRFHRHAMRGQQRYERMSQLPRHPRAAKPGGLGDLAKLPPDVVIIKRRADCGREDQVVVLP